MEDKKWRIRFENFEKAFNLLRSSFDKESPFSDLEKEGIFQRFEYTFELSWKTLKDYMEENGIVLEEVTPRNVIKKAFDAKIIEDGELWVKMLILRKKLFYDYSQDVLNESFDSIKNTYINTLNDFYVFLRRKIFYYGKNNC